MSQQNQTPDLLSPRPTDWHHLGGRLPDNGRDEWWDEETRTAARDRLRAQRRDSLRLVFRFLFVHGGVSVVLLFGLMAFGLIAAFVHLP